MGSNTYIKKETWERIVGKKKDTEYVREFMLFFWKPEQLQNRCFEPDRVKGETRPVLTPYKVNIIIGKTHKIEKKCKSLCHCFLIILKM